GGLRNLAGKHLHHGTVVVEGYGAAPVFQQPQKVFHSAAIAAVGGSNVSRQQGGVDGVRRGDALGNGVGAGGVEGGPGRGQDGDRIRKDGAGEGIGDRVGIGGQVDGCATGIDVRRDVPEPGHVN